MMDEVIPSERAPRDFRVKFPDDVMQENLAGQLWFGAEVRRIRVAYITRVGEERKVSDPSHVIRISRHSLSSILILKE